MNKNTLETERLVLSEITMADHDALQKMYMNAANVKYLKFEPHDINETKKVIETCFLPVYKEAPRLTYRYKIETKDHEFVGICSLSIQDNYEKKLTNAEIGYILTEAQWGRGYATEVSKRLIKLGFEDLKMHRIFGIPNVDNTRSCNVLEKCGMKKEGEEREVFFKDNKWHNQYIYSILKSEYSQDGE